MDNFEETEPLSHEDDQIEALWISEDVRSYLYETAKWAKFLAIVGFVFAAMTAIGAMGAGAILTSMSAVSPNNPLMKVGTTGLALIYLLFAFVQFYPSYLLYKFSSATNQAVLYSDQDSLAIAMGKIKSFFKFFGIITIFFIGFYAVMIVFMAVVGVAVAGR